MMIMTMIKIMVVVGSFLTEIGVAIVTITPTDLHSTEQWLARQFEHLVNGLVGTKKHPSHTFPRA